MAHDFPFLRSGDELHPYHINEIYKELRRWRWATGDGGVIVDGANSATVSPIFRLAGISRSSGTTYVQITGNADATFGGYSWQEVVWSPALYLIDRGSGYTSSPSFSWSGTGTGSTNPTATIDVNDDGTLKSPNIVTTGSKLVTLSASLTGGGGSGATLGCILDGGKLTGGGWVATGAVGGVGANDAYGHPTPGDLAYEARGSLSVPLSGTGSPPWPQGAVYPAFRDAGGRLLFFSSGIVPAQTVTISSYPTTAAVFYGCKALLYSGLNGSSQIPAEGDTPGISTASVTFLAANLGSSVPTSGSYVKTEMVPTPNGPIFVFRYD